MMKLAYLWWPYYDDEVRVVTDRPSFGKWKRIAFIEVETEGVL